MTIVIGSDQGEIQRIASNMIDQVTQPVERATDESRSNKLPYSFNSKKDEEFRNGLSSKECVMGKVSNFLISDDWIAPVISCVVVLGPHHTLTLSSRTLA